MGRTTTRRTGHLSAGLTAMALGLAVLGGAPPAAAGPVIAGDVLPACTSMSDWPARPVTPDVRHAVARYYQAKDLAPVRIVGHREYVLDVDEQSVGTHQCLNADGSTSGYVGQVPSWAARAVMVQARHRPYPGTGAPANFVTLARGPGHGWTVVGEGTGP
jgi:hypothetical protein